MDLRERVGIGYSNQFASVSSLSVRYHLPTRSPTIRLAVELAAGASVMNSPTAPTTYNGWFGGGRVLYGLVAEDNMTLYAAAGLGFTSTGADQAVRLQPALGAEFFLYGLENLGISTEWGLNVDMGSPTRLYTVSGGPAVSVHYYF
jgi:hypothetical protein